MREDVERLLTSAMQLPIKARAQFAAALIASIERDPDAAWEDEIERRATRALAGESEGRPWREALDRIDPRRGR